jgi:hypothetical protein
LFIYQSYQKGAPMQRKVFLSLAVTSLILSLLGCSSSGSGTPRPGVGTPALNAAETPLPSGVDLSANLTVSSATGFTTAEGRYLVVGEVTNNANTPATSIELTLEIKDASGASMLKDYGGTTIPSITLHPMVPTIAPGMSSPFSYDPFFDASTPTPATVKVTVTSAISTEASQVEIIADHVQLVHDSLNYFLTGELVNSTADWVLVNGLSGGVVDSGEQLLSASKGWSNLELAPAGDALGRDRLPFMISIPMPGGNEPQWKLWWEAETTAIPIDYSIEINMTNTYFDASGQYHVVGTSTNHADVALYTLIFAGVYAQDGTVLDAFLVEAYLPAAPGQAVPFDITPFYPISKLPDQRARVNYVSLNVLPVSTHVYTVDKLELTSPDEVVEIFGGSTLIFNGSFTNTTDTAVANPILVAALYDQAHKLVAAHMGYLNGMAPGAKTGYAFGIPLDPSVDPASLTNELTLFSIIQP